MRENVIQTFKHKNRIICYIIRNQSGTYETRTGKPSDATYIGWKYETFEDAQFTAKEYFSNYLNQ